MSSPNSASAINYLHTFSLFSESRYSDTLNRSDSRLDFITEYLSSGSEGILLICHEIQPSGASLLFLNVVHGLLERKYKPIILLNEGASICAEYFEELNSIALCLIVAESECDSILETIRNCNVIRCISNTIVSALFLKKLKKYGFKTVQLIHEMKSALSILNAQDTLCENVCKYADVIVFPCMAVQNDFFAFAAQSAVGRTLILPQGIYKDLHISTDKEDARKRIINQSNLPSDAKLVVSSGAVNFGKGADLLALILSALKKSESGNGTQYHVFWLGSIPESDSINYQYFLWLKRQIETAGLTERWHWTGFLSGEEYNTFIQGADCFASVSREDSFPAVLLEAASFETPIICFSGTGGGEEIVNMQSGLLIEPFDINMYAEAIEQLCTLDSNSFRKYHIAAENLKSLFSFEDYLDKLIQLFDIDSGD